MVMTAAEARAKASVAQFERLWNSQYKHRVNEAVRTGAMRIRISQPSPENESHFVRLGYQVVYDNGNWFLRW